MSDGSSKYDVFHEVIASIKANSLVEADLLHAGLFLTVGPGVHVRQNDLPDVEKLRSLLLDFRKLIAEKEPSFLNRVHNIAVQDSSLSGDQIQRVKAARAKFNEALDQKADMYSGATRPSIRTILDDWIDGEWFHTDAERRTARLQYEFSAKDDLSLNLLVPALRVAIEAAIELDAALRA